jgi:hypothetical protein
MYFIYKYITNATTTAINACNFFYLTLVKGGQLFLFTLPNKGEYSIFIQGVRKSFSLRQHQGRDVCFF